MVCDTQSLYSTFKLLTLIFRAVKRDLNQASFLAIAPTRYKEPVSIYEEAIRWNFQLDLW